MWIAFPHSSPEMPRSGFTVELDAANAAWLTNDVAMFSTKSGELLLLTLVYDGRLVTCFLFIYFFFFFYQDRIWNFYFVGACPWLTIPRNNVWFYFCLFYVLKIESHFIYLVVHASHLVVLTTKTIAKNFDHILFWKGWDVEMLLGFFAAALSFWR